MRTYTRIAIGTLALGLVAIPGIGRAQEHRDEDMRNLPNPMETVRNIQNLGRTLFMMADVNRDGQISQKEAIDANNVMVGGFFFQADADGNGAVSQEEAKAVRDTYLNQNPWARYAVESFESQQKNQQNSNQANPIQGMSALLDSNNDKQIQSQELRQFVQTVTQSYFAAADTNRDNLISPSEINASIEGGVRALSQLAFQQADADNNGQLSRAEYDKAIVEPANVAFQMIDQNHDGQISQQEAQEMERTVLSQIRMMQLPEPANSPTNLIGSGKLPSEVSPVPTFGTSNPGQGQNRTQPGQGQNRTQPGQGRAQPGQPAPPPASRR